MKIDILIQNGHVIDTKSGVNGKKTIGIQDGKIVDVASDDVTDAGLIINAKDSYVFPGLIDFHTHLFYKGSDFAYNPEWLLATGVTAAVDPGTCGCANFGIFQDTVVARSSVKIKSFINVYPGGIYAYKVHPHYAPELFNEAKIIALHERYPDDVLGLKVMLSHYNVGEHGIGILEKALRLSEKIKGSQVCVHTTDLPCEASEVLDMLRHGDIFCHMYSKGGTITDENGKIYRAARDARVRGVLFDAANARIHFDFNVANAAIAEGFLPDIISTDAVSQSFNVGNYAKNVPFVMSKYLNMGLDLETVVRAVTEVPARAMKMEGKIGTLAPGAFADVSICQMVDKEVTYLDVNKSGSVTGRQFLVPRLTIADGVVAYCQADFM